MTPSLGLAYAIWTRHSRGLILYGSGLALVVSLRSYFANTNTFRSSWDKPWFLAATVLLGIYAVAYFPVVFSFGIDTRIERSESGFPARLWHLPVRTRALVGWPMLWGTIAAMIVWLILATGVLRPCGFDVALWWPGLLFGAVLTWIQALLWISFPLTWLRVICMVPVVCTVSVVPPLLGFYDPSEAWLCVALLLLGFLAFCIAYREVARARRGEARGREWPTLTLRLFGKRRFNSSVSAQNWYEWRRCGFSFPLMVTFVSVVWLVALTSISEFVDDAAKNQFYFFPKVWLSEIGSLWLTSACLLVFPFVFAGICGPEFGKLPPRDRTEAISSFLASRPISIFTFLRAKCEAAVLSTVLSWGILVSGFLIWFALSGKSKEMINQWENFGLRHRMAFSREIVGFSIFGLIGCSWLNLIGGFWMGQAGRLWRTLVAVWFVTFLLVLFAFGEWMANVPDEWKPTIDSLPWLALAAFQFKVMIASWSILALRRNRLMTRWDLVIVSLLWLLLAGFLVYCIYALLPNNYVPLSAIVLAVLFLFPFTRLALAPLTLHANRHC